MADARRTHSPTERVTLAETAAEEAATFYHGLRARKVPPAPASAMSEAYVTAMLARDDDPPEPWMAQ